MIPAGKRPTAEIGLGLQSNKAPGTYAELAARAEADGIDVVSVFGDFMYQPPLAALLEMARATSRVRLGPACLNPFSMHPYEIAGQAAVLDLAAEGRSYLGLARGTWLGAAGLAQAKPISALSDAASIVRALLAGDRSGYAGEVYELAPDAGLRYDRYRPEVPLLIGTWGTRTAALAGRIAHEVKVGGSANPSMVSVIRERITTGARSVGRDPDDIGIVFGAVTVVAEDGELARQMARVEVAMYLDVVAELDPTIDVSDALLAHVRRCLAAGDDTGAGAEIPDDVLDLFAFSGTPQHVANQANELIAAGVSRVEFGTPHGFTDLGGVAMIGSEVLPRIERDRPRAWRP